jgi:hypothetical protein
MSCWPKFKQELEDVKPGFDGEDSECPVPSAESIEKVGKVVMWLESNGFDIECISVDPDVLGGCGVFLEMKNANGEFSEDAGYVWFCILNEYDNDGLFIVDKDGKKFGAKPITQENLVWLKTLFN